MADQYAYSQKFDGRIFTCTFGPEDLWVVQNNVRKDLVTLLVANKNQTLGVELSKYHTLQLAQYLTELAENLE
jgi:hypothetical protein